MDESNQTVGTEAEAEGQNETNILQRDYTYSFKKVSVKDFQEAYSEADLQNPEFLKQFETVDEDGKATDKEEEIKGYRRKPIKTTLMLPEFLLAIPAENRSTVADILANTVASYVKGTYIDQFLPIGDHDWSNIQKELNQRGGRGRQLDFSEATHKSAAAHFGGFVGQSIGNDEIGGRMAKIALGKFSRSAITRQADAFDEVIIKKLLTWVEKWAMFVAEHDSDNSEEFTPVYDYWTTVLDRHLKSDNKKVDLSEML